MFDVRGMTAVVTGASSGIGETFARALGAEGCHLFLVARSEEKLERLARQLRSAYRVLVTVVAADLSRREGIATVVDTVARRGLSVDVLVNNAAFGTYGRFEEQSPSREHDELMLNAGAVVELTHAFLPGMLGRHRGAVINVASTAGFQPVPYMAVYAATKAFVLSFTEALWAETSGRGVRILAVCPGLAPSRLFGLLGRMNGALGVSAPPEQVVEDALRALQNDRSVVVAGWRNALIAGVSRLAGREQAARLTELMMRPRPLKLSEARHKLQARTMLDSLP